MNNKGADQTARMCRLICGFVVRIWQKQVFSWRGSYGFRQKIAEFTVTNFRPYLIRYHVIFASVLTKSSKTVRGQNFANCPGMDKCDYRARTESQPSASLSVDLLRIVQLESSDELTFSTTKDTSSCVSSFLVTHLRVLSRSILFKKLSPSKSKNISIP